MHRRGASPSLGQVFRLLLMVLLGYMLALGTTAVWKRDNVASISETQNQKGLEYKLSTFVELQDLKDDAISMHKGAVQMHPHPKDDEAYLDRGDELDSLEVRASFLNLLYKQLNKGNRTKVCVVTLTPANIWEVRKKVFPWIQYHLEVGVSRFYLFYDGTDAQALKILHSIDAAKVLAIRPPLTDPEIQGMVNNFQKRNYNWDNRPGNFVNMVRQAFAVELAIEEALVEKMDWIIHIDQDELFLGEADRSLSIADILGSQPDHVGAVKFANNEAYPERGDVINPFDQVSLFKVNSHFWPEHAWVHDRKGALGPNPGTFLLYGNGKSAARVDAPGLHGNGPHEFRADSSNRWKSETNQNGEFRVTMSALSSILHYTYCTFDDMVRKAARSCPGSFKGAAIKNDRTATKLCFVLDFDQDVFHVAAHNNSREMESFFLSRVVLEPGAVTKCVKEGRNGYCLIEDVEKLKSFMLKEGLFRRTLIPRQILRMHERTIQNMFHGREKHDKYKML